MKAMILAAGYGKRLMPLTKDTPKPLLKVGNKSLIQRNINYLIKNGFSEIVINISHFGELVQQHVEDNFPDKDISFSYEKRPLGTGGGILNALKLLGNEPFLVINSDIYHDINIKNLPKNINAAHLIGVKNPSHNHLGDFSLKGKTIVINKNNNDLTWCGISIINPIIFEEHTFDDDSFSIWKAVLPQFIEKGMVTGQISSEPWIDVGTLDRLKLANSVYNEN
ncbi:MAG: nucleotidyl transferase [Gammaproteobacteria bacterium]|nr:nucleotidyl transferase [Gammaproteobacteria bacterium]|tara:strand:+ start:100 stop:768 length:669 start_codon:yes stop_codon:yes gene_type:complete